MNVIQIALENLEFNAYWNMLDNGRKLPPNKRLLIAMYVFSVAQVFHY